MLFAYEKLHKNDFKFLNKSLENKIKILNLDTKINKFHKNIIITPYIDKQLQDYILSYEYSKKFFVILTSNGYDTLDSKKILNKKNIIITNSKSNSGVVGEYALGLILDSFKKISFHNNQIRNGLWMRYGSKNFLPPIKLENKNFAIYGFGEIAKKIYKLLRPFNVNIATFKNSHILKKRLPRDLIVFKNTRKLSSWADCHINCLPLNNKTQNFFGKKFFNNIKRSIFINISRGNIVNTNELLKSLSNKKIIHYASDVYDNYPQKWTGSTKEIEKLKKMSCTLSPKRAGYSYNELPHLNDVIYNINKIIKNKERHLKNVISR